MTEKIEIRDPRCKDGDCLFPNCGCEYPPHEVPKPSYIQTGLIVWASIGIVIAMVIALSLTAWFHVYLLND